MTAHTPLISVATLYSPHMDRELQHRLASFLSQRGVPGANCIRLNVHGGVVAVSGKAPTKQAKWLCIECCRRVAGVIKIIDQLNGASPIRHTHRAETIGAQGRLHDQGLQAFPKSMRTSRRQPSPSPRQALGGNRLSHTAVV